ncbi:hypothetical protein FHT44_004937 [Mycolicibacterium sp. BK634]|uniref:hypothetical protein n=1 Tax=Mycolicibacterium sp. BK634 TaxID=2587099 RepID=UPI00161A9AE1|nr:hypothetical protein [Mycolicibacterium sp. BK634]MBB3752425.1 hypothetical protein [Mycolicibacterium sp. BK634]
MSRDFDDVAKVYVTRKIGRRIGNREIRSVDFEFSSYMDGCCEECQYPTSEIRVSVWFTDGSHESFETGSWLEEFLKELVAAAE